MDRTMAENYTLIYTFLVQNSLTKTAQALKKEVKDVVVLKDGVNTEGPSLNKILHNWKTHQRKQAFSSNESTSDSDSDSDEATAQTLVQKTKAKKADSNPSEDKNDSGSESDDESSDHDPEVPSKLETSSNSKITLTSYLKPLPTKDASTEREASRILPSVAAKKDDTDSDSSNLSSSSSSLPSSSSGSSSDSDSKPTAPPGSTVKTKKTSKIGHKQKNVMKRSRGSSSSGPSGNPLESEDEKKIKIDVEKKNSKKGRDRKREKDINKNAAAGPGSKAIDSSQKISVLSESKPDAERISDSKSKYKQKSKSKSGNAPNPAEEQVRTTKKRRISQDGTAISTVTIDTFGQAPLSSANDNIVNGKKGTSSGARFQRINPDSVSTNLMIDSRYETKTGPMNDYGRRAHQDLIVTRGAGFRKEKNKKKRGSYKGGEITLQSHSYKFTD